MKNFQNIILLVFVLLTLSFSVSCGGGGGGESNEGNPARVSLDVHPSVIDSGDRTNITIRVEDVYSINNDGIVLKVRYPSGLKYILGSAMYFSDAKDEGESISPFGDNADESTYLVITIRPPGTSSGDGVISFQLEGRFEIKDGVIEVDVDREDKETSQIDFDIDNPQFTSLVESSIKVLGE